MGIPRRILIIRPSALGDVCRTVPVLVSLKRHYPRAAIDWLVQDSFAPAVVAHPDLSRVVPFARSRMSLTKLWRPAAQRELGSLLHGLRAASYDLVVDCQGLGRSGFFAWVTGAKERLGFAGAREFGWLGVNRRIRVPKGMHTVDRMLALIEALGVPIVRDLRLYTTPADRAALDPNLKGARFAVIAPTSRWPGKQWPAERYVELTQRLLAEGGIERIAVVGAAGERGQIEPVLALAQRDPRVIDLVGATRVGALMATVEASALVVANDSAALHMAVGFDRPMVGLYGPTRIDLVGPYRREHDVIQIAEPGARNRHKDARAGRRAMQAITVEWVAEAALNRLQAPSSPARARSRETARHGV